jgi:hypothetical protein
METLGSLCDKFSIAVIRSEDLQRRFQNNQTDGDLRTLLALVHQQRSDLEKEMNELISDATKNGRAPLEPKYKIYKGEDSSKVKFENWSDAFDSICLTNKTLWNLEDSRRDKTKSDAEIRAICDDVAKYNRLRNDTMDEINRLFNESVKSRKTQQ